MKLIEIINAGAALRKLMMQDLPLTQAYKITLLVDKLNPHLAFFDNKRTEIMEQVENGNESNLEELFNTEVELELVPVEVKLNDTIALSPNDILILNSFIKFVE